MGVEDVTRDEVIAEVLAYLEEPDYHALGYASTRELADGAGKPVEWMTKRLARLLRDGKVEKVIDGSRKCWWRAKR